MTLASLDPAPFPEAHDAPAAVRDALGRVLAADEFVSSPRLADFLRFIVEATLAGRAEEIKGYTIAVEALGRPPSFDPQSDPIVRVEATRLRRALERYYSTAGAQEPLEIAVPKGSYVPLFRERTLRFEPQPAEAPAPLPAEAAPPPARRPGGRRLRRIAAIAAAFALVSLVIAVSGVQIGIENGPGRLTVTLGGRPTTAAELADRMGMPILEVRPFERAGAPPPEADAIHTLEVRLRDAFSRFDFVDVLAASTAASPHECRGAPPRSVFSLSGLAEGHGEDRFSLLLRLSDRCSGNIVWSQELADLFRGPDRAATEQQVVREVAASLMESYAALPTRARAQARLEAPESGFGCISRNFAALRGDPSADPLAAKTCLEGLVSRDRGFGIVHSVQAMRMLEDALAATDSEPDATLVDRIQREAELGAELAPTSAFAARVLASVDFFRGEREMALAAASRAVALNPLDFDVAAAAGAMMIGLGKTEQGEALLTYAREHGAARNRLYDAYLGLAAFLRSDPAAAAAMVPPLETHPSPQTRIALALALHVLGRAEDERRVVATLLRETPGGLAGVRRAVRRIMPDAEGAARILGELEAAGLARDARAPLASRG
ncbi:hypothetical protein [Aquabacter spiritensis]|uniref:Adenylate cyclase n=1 Tax=Aquabacter spiritensis TaxID=933073 RepID=A0A4R3LR37_9HYPH|nr:hypothetical protein [Aquabacter spiritensis]TCT02079.1 hypothetical protein EDC64_115110 [Aquabacter spiritensis]